LGLVGAAVSIGAAGRAAAPEPAVYVEEGLRPELLKAAQDAAAAFAFDSNAKMVVVDFKWHSSKPRLFVVAPKTGAVKSMLCAHGIGSDTAHSGYATTFSNTPNSGASSLGAFRVLGPGYGAKHGPNLLLEGLERTNDKAKAREIIVHSAWYAEPDIVLAQGKMGRSNGCFVTSDKDRDTLFEMLSPGALLYAGV
jgi:hypothetical protein